MVFIAQKLSRQHWVILTKKPDAKLNILIFSKRYLDMLRTLLIESDVIKQVPLMPKHVEA